MVFVGAHVSHLPFVPDAANEGTATALHMAQHGQADLRVGGTLSHSTNAEAHAANVVGTSACCIDVLLSFPSRSVHLAVIASIGAALLGVASVAPRVWSTWSVPIYSPGKRRALLQVYLN